MAISREKKEQLVEDLKQKLGTADVIILTDFRGLSVSAQQELRGKLRDASAEYQVVKNTLTQIALEATDRPVPEEYLIGPTAVALLRGDVASPAKALLDFVKETGLLTIKGGIVGNRIVDAKRVEDLADLPSKETLLAQVIGALQGPTSSLVRVLTAPASDLVRTLEAPQRDLVSTIQAYADQQQ